MGRVCAPEGQSGGEAGEAGACYYYVHFFFLFLFPFDEMSWITSVGWWNILMGMDEMGRDLKVLFGCRKSSVVEILHAFVGQ